MEMGGFEKIEVKQVFSLSFFLGKYADEMRRELWIRPEARGQTASGMANRNHFVSSILFLSFF